jgi:uncharacterized membrane protein
MAIRDVPANELERARTDESHAKHPVTRLSGPYGHPFHPILVTIPIGAWVASLVFDILSRVADDGAAFARGAYWLIIIGVIGAAAAAVFGLMDLLAIPRDTPARRVGLTHMVLNVLVLGAFIASFIWRAARGAELETTAGMYVLSGVALGVLVVSGWLGGKLAYRFGVRVADEDAQLDGYLHHTRPRTQRPSMN